LPYQLENDGGSPVESLNRYSFSSKGDDPATPKNEAFDGPVQPIADRATLWQGEIAGDVKLLRPSPTST
jgi:hypothetical protein